MEFLISKKDWKKSGTGLPSPIKGIPRTDSHKIAISNGMKKAPLEKRLERNKLNSERIKKWWSENHDQILKWQHRL